MTTITIARTHSTQAVENFTRIFNRKSYMKLQVHAAPAGGEFEVIISTDTLASHNELQDMINGIMFYELSR